MMTLAIFLNGFKPLVPASVLAFSSVPYFVSVVGWWTISRIFPRRWYARIDDVMYSCYQRLVLFFFENVSGITLNLYGDIDDERVRNNKECVLYISNHQCTVDWAVADMLAIRQGSLGHLRYVLKHALQYIPLYGFYFYMHGSVYVRRSGKFRKDASVRQLQYIANLEEPTWLVIFPEGTRYSPKKKKAIEQSQQFAKENGLEPLEYVLMPRSRGFEMALENLRHRLDAVYDVTIAYSQAIDRNSGKVTSGPSMFDFVCSEPGAALHVHLSRIPINEIPSGSADIREWMYERFKRKDQLLKEYYQKRLSNKTPPDNADAFPDLKITDACLPLKSTLPSALLITGCGLLPLILTPVGRKAYVAVLVLGTVFGVGYLQLKKAC